MHYVISFDLHDDHLRARFVKRLEKNGCRRVQKSVFVAPHMEKKHLAVLQLALRRLLASKPLEPGDSIYLLPLPDEQAAAAEHLGDNNVIAELTEKKLKTML